MNPVPVDVPRGVGIYCERGDSIGSPDATRALIGRLLRARARNVSLCGEASDGWRPSRARFAAVVDRLADAGFAVHAYALPGVHRARQGAKVSEELLELAEGLRLAGLQLDAEEPYRGLPLELRAAWAALVEGSTEARSVGVTLYGLPTEGGRFPWAEILGRGWLGWQCYERAGYALDHRQAARAGLEVMRRSWGARCVVPHVAGYSRKASQAGELSDGPARLVADLDRVCRDGFGTIDVPGAWVWADGSLSVAELEALGAWALAAGW